MSLIVLDESNFNDVINDNDIVIISFGTAADEHCKEMAALLSECSVKYPDVTFATCDVGALPEAARSFQISALPTVIVFREQIMLFAEPSAKRSAWLRSQDRLDTAVSRIKQIDMNKVRQMSDPAKLQP
jgi:thioredoxin 1